MQLSDILNQTGGLRSIARELGIGEEEAARGASALAPAVLGGFRKQAEASPGGLEGLGGLLNQLGGGGMLDSLLSPDPTDTAPGNNVIAMPMINAKNMRCSMFASSLPATAKNGFFGTIVSTTAIKGFGVALLACFAASTVFVASFA